ncbi:MAG: hypothetical protein IJX52_05655 [Oscillibacter sp.]|nr:hypothetical protein [Oscillibacter sp.]
MMILVLLFLLALALLHGYVESFRRGPSRCMGCGKCDHNGGVCILTGRSLATGRPAGKTSPLTNGENGI